MNHQCKAYVRVGSYTYIARNTDRQCLNHARPGSDYCYTHRSKDAIKPLDPEVMAQLRAKLGFI